MWREALVTKIEKLKHVAWGPSHCRRVYAMATDLAAEEGMAVDDDVLFALSWLHDVGTFPEHVVAGESPPECAARAAEGILPGLGFPTEKADAVTHIIRSHDFERPPLPWPEAQAFHDADMLDFLGSIGVTRLLTIVGLEDWTPDTRSAIDVMRTFADELPDKLVLDTSKLVAELRRAETQSFLSTLDAETGRLAVL